MNTFQLERKGRSKLPSVNRSRKDYGSFDEESENYKLEVTSRQNVFPFSSSVMFISSTQYKKGTPNQTALLRILIQKPIF